MMESAETKFVPRVITTSPGTGIREFEEGHVLKCGSRVKTAEALAMRLVAKHTTVPVPLVLCCSFQIPKCGVIMMPLVPGVCLKDVWNGLDAQAKTSICTQVWNFVNEWKHIPKPLELQHLYQCSTDGKSGNDPLLTKNEVSLIEKDSDIVSEKALRERICQNYYDCNGRQYTKAQMFDMLPSGHPSVFTHGDLAPKNIMVSGSQVTGIIDWEAAGWYPEYWEYMNVMTPFYSRDWSDWQLFMKACAPQTWDYPEGILAAQQVLF